MWDNIEKHLPKFDSAVLNFADAEGYPYSVRCRLEQDRIAGVLRLEDTNEEELNTGPASILCHSHDDKTSNQKIFVLRGNLEETGNGWAFRPEKFVSSIGTSSALGMMRMFRGINRSSRSYLKKRNLPRPHIAWGEIQAVKKRTLG